MFEPTCSIPPEQDVFRNEALMRALALSRRSLPRVVLVTMLAPTAVASCGDITEPAHRSAASLANREASVGTTSRAGESENALCLAYREERLSAQVKSRSRSADLSEQLATY